MFKKLMTPNNWLQCSEWKNRFYHYEEGVEYEESGFHRSGYICGNGHWKKELEGLHIDRRTGTWINQPTAPDRSVGSLSTEEFPASKISLHV
jgi:hypothetical protein